MAPLPLKTLIGEKNARVLRHIFKMAPLPLKTLIGEKECYGLGCQQPSGEEICVCLRLRNCARANCALHTCLY